MNLSKSEKVLVSIFGIVLFFIGVFFLVFKPMTSKVKGVKEEVLQLENTYSYQLSGLGNIAEYQQEIDTLLLEIKDMDQQLPSNITQEFVIQTLDETIRKLQLDFRSFGFSEVTAFSLDENTAAVDAEQNIEATATGDYGIRTSINLSGNCSYKQLKDFHAQIKQWSVATAIEQMTISTNETGLSVNMVISLYGIRYPEVIDNEVDLPAYEKGKTVLFAQSQKTEEEEENKYENVFVVVDPIQSDNSAITLGLYGDALQTSYLEEETNEVMDAVISFTQVGNTYQVSYELNGKKFPAQGTHTIEADEMFGVVIQCAKRVSEIDVNGLRLTLNNSTDKVVQIDVRNEDSLRPRVEFVETNGEFIVR